MAGPSFCHQILGRSRRTPLRQAIGAVLVVSFALALARRTFFRVAVYAVLAAAVLLISEHVAKPLVQRTSYGELTFPSGNLTAVSATAMARCLALYPLLGKRARNVTLVVGVPGLC